MSMKSCFAFCICLFLAFSATAHDPGLSSAKLSLQNNSLRAILTFAPADMEAISGQNAPQGAANLKQLEAIARKSLEIWFDGQPVAPTVVHVQFLQNKDVEFQLTFPAAFVMHLRARSALLDHLPFGHRQYFALVNAAGMTLAEKLLGGACNSVDIDLQPPLATVATPPSHPFSEFLVMGVKHILTGYDHLLFLFALLIGCKQISSIIKIITAFTIAHSISLALATLGWVEIPSRIIEPFIAATIVYVGIENLFRGQAVNHRVWLTFGFGLVHGFGFASALREMGVGSNGSAVAIPLVAFNSGVEIGQMLVALVILPILWRFKDKPQFALRWAPACSALVVLAGGFWFLQRVWPN
jgi:hydrogenase/urease accessory protein HupE